MKKIVFLFVLIFFPICFFQNAIAQENDRWLQDFEAMKRFMAEAYANLEWAKDYKKIDLAALNKETTEKLKNASTDKEARKILDNFLKTFQDGHLRLQEVKSTSTQSNDTRMSFARDESADKVCNALGYRFRIHTFSVPFEKAPDFEFISTSKDYFPAGIFKLENGKSFAVLKIGLFSSDGFRGNCLAGWEEFRAELDKNCEGDCIGKFHKLLDNRLSAKLAEQIRILQKQNPDYLIVDIGGNGGGSNWVEPAARMISPKPLRGTLAGFIRHPHWVNILEQRLKTISEDLARKDLNKKQIGYLKTAKKRLERSLKEAKSSCDRTNFWNADTKQKNCTLLNTTPVMTGGIFEHLPISEIADLKSKTILFQPSEYEFEESVFKGNLVVLVDRNTASAAENFATYMQISKSGTVVGEKSFGAGCGYVNGGTKYFLPNSKLQLLMPDCVRYRVDGANEVEGVEPDVLLWEKTDNKSEKLEKLLMYLSKI